ncbi:MAG: hypothetical protein CMJ83_17930 [Planctomycetes bacterium]|nr:hypothetical protein [Planctomycetota bacterium]
MRNLVVAIFVLGLIVLGWLLLREEGAVEDDPGRAAPASVIPDPAPDPVAPGAPISSVPFVEPRVPEDLTPDETTGPTIEVQVLEKETGAPVADAEVVVTSMSAYLAAVRTLRTFHGSPASRRARRRLGRAENTGEDGIVRVAVRGDGKGAHWVEARKGDLWDFRYLIRITKEPVVLSLVRDQLLRVRVRGHGGRPRSGVPVAVRRASGPRRFSFKKTETEPPAGIATFEHMQRRFAQGDGWHATFAFPMIDPPGVPVDEGQLPAEPIDLALPGAGSLDVTVRDGGGRLVDGERDGFRIVVEAFAGPEEREPLWPDGPTSKPELRQGRARVPWLGLGLFLRVTAESTKAKSGRKPVVVTLAGPRTDGDVVACTLEVPFEAAPSAVVVGRLVRRDGTPWSRTEIWAWSRLVPYRPDTHQETITTTGDGRFRLLVRDPIPEGGSRRIRLTVRGPEGNGTVGWLDLSRALSAGPNDVGDVVLDLGELLVGGQVVDDTGRPVEGARYSVGMLVEKNGKEYWPDVRVSGDPLTDDQGRFAVYTVTGDPLPTTALRFRARHSGFLSGERVPFSIGTRSLHYVIERAGGLAGSVVLASGQAPEDFKITIWRGKSPSWAEVRTDGSFEKSALRAGRVDVTIELLTGTYDGAPSKKVKDLEIVAGVVTRDPRLQNVRLESDVKKVALTLVDRTGAPVGRARVEVLGDANPRATYSDGKGRVVVRSKTLPLDCRITAWGFRRRVVRDVRADRRVVLDRGLDVRIITSVQTKGSDPEYLLGAQVVRVKPNGMHEYVFARISPARGTLFDAKGRLKLRFPEPGTFRIDPYLVVIGPVASGGSIGMKPVPEITVRDVPGPQTFRIDIPQELVNSAIKKLR